MDRSFLGKVALVTGASRGVGRRLTVRMAEAGASVAFAARRVEAISALEAELRSAGHDVLGVPADVGRFESCRDLVQATLDRWGRVDVLVNCAGISGPHKPITELEPDEFDEVMRVNLYAAYACIRFAVPSMIERQSGAIVNIGSMTGKRPLAMRTPYATSKMALVGLTRTVALELAPHKVRCNTISPGPIAGERVEEVMQNTARSRGLPIDDVRASFNAWSPMNEMVTEDDICDLAMFLASDSGRHMTGQDINMTAGTVMY